VETENGKDKKDRLVLAAIVAALIVAVALAAFWGAI
jgi:hypothetical protein